MIENKYKNQEEKLLLSKVLDKIEFCNKRNKIEFTQFLDTSQIALIEKFLKQEKIKNYFFTGGYDDAERKILIIFPEKMQNLIENIDLNFYIKVIRITLPNEQKGKYIHKNYLGGLMKLGIKREKIGDILVDDNGADILICPDIEKFLYSNICSLTRFQKSEIEIINIENLKRIEIKKENFNITVSSMRLDCIIAELIKGSRSKAEEILLSQRVFVNNESITKQTKEIKQGDKITIRGKGRFEIIKIVGNTRKGRIVVEVQK